MMPLVSIIIPVYNVERYLKECLDSVLKQTLEDLEIICINDGSTDMCGVILDEYACLDSRIIVIHKHNAGYGAAVNDGIKMATGEYIGIVESDDFISSDMYKTLYEVATKNGAEVVMSNRIDYYANVQYNIDCYFNIPQNVCIKPIEYVPDIYLSHSVWNGIYLREFLLNKGILFNETPGASYQDTGFYLKVILAAESFVFIPRYYYSYRRDNDNSSVYSSAKVFCVCDEFDSVERYIDERFSDAHYKKSKILPCKFDVYMWNYNRLSQNFKDSFFDRLVREFMFHKKQNLLDESAWREYPWKKLTGMLEAPDIWKSYLYAEAQDLDLLMFPLRQICLQYKYVYVYGAGQIANNVMSKVNGRTYSKINAIVVTNRENTGEVFCGKDVISLNDVTSAKNETFFFIAVGKKLQGVIRSNLRERGYENFWVVTERISNMLEKYN